QQGRDCMQGIEPASCLVHSFCDKICRINPIKWIFKWPGMIRLQFLRIQTPLGIGHRATVEPNIDQVGHTLHWLSTIRNQYDIIYVWAVQIELLTKFFL